MGRSSNRVVATCRVLPAGELPEWVELLPGRDIVGIDGRRFTLEDPAAVVAAFVARHVDLVVDREHASEIKAPEGEEAPAAGWITGFQVREGAIWGRCDWTPRGAESVRSREYRYISPAFIYTPDGHVLALVSVGLTNQPNLDLPALNRAGSSEEDTRMDPKLLEALGLPATATNADVLAAIARLQGDLQVAKNRAETPSLEKFVPRPDFEAALNRAKTAETKLAERVQADAEKEIETLIAEARRWKITPATTDFYRAQCRQEGGVARFREFLAKAPKIAEATLPPKPGDAASTTAALSEVQRAICRNLGIPEDKFRKTSV